MQIFKNFDEALGQRINCEKATLFFSRNMQQIMQEARSPTDQSARKITWITLPNWTIKTKCIFQISKNTYEGKYEDRRVLAPLG